MPHRDSYRGNRDAVVPERLRVRQGDAARHGGAVQDTGNLRTYPWFQQLGRAVGFLPSQSGVPSLPALEVVKLHTTDTPLSLALFRIQP